MSKSLPAPGDFSFMNTNDNYLLSDAYRAITVAGQWDFMRTEEPPEGQGYMFWPHPSLSAITKEMNCDHSGASYGWTMRQMQFIAKRGWDEYVVSCLLGEKMKHSVS